jgi:hypothetical protein
MHEKIHLHSEANMAQNRNWPAIFSHVEFQNSVSSDLDAHTRSQTDGHTASIKYIVACRPVYGQRLGKHVLVVKR